MTELAFADDSSLLPNDAVREIGDELSVGSYEARYTDTDEDDDTKE